MAKDDEPKEPKEPEFLACGDPRDGRTEVTFTSCGQIYCEVHAGANTRKTAKHSQLPPFDRGGKPKP